MAPSIYNVLLPCAAAAISAAVVVAVQRAMATKEPLHQELESLEEVLKECQMKPEEAKTSELLEEAPKECETELEATKTVTLLEEALKACEKELEATKTERAAERIGRIRAQQELRNGFIGNNCEDASVTAYPMTPIGTIRSCFSTRNGTPRQPLLVSKARSCLVLTPGGVPAEAFHGLAGYSHCWLLYVFHENTDLPRLWKKPAHSDFKAKVHVPRLNGQKIGVLATRTPHRPLPIGLSVAKVEGVHQGKLFLSGADLVDGTPVLDVKPYLPYCDSIPGAAAPSYVKAGDADDVIAVHSVECTAPFHSELQKCWKQMGKHALYSTPEEFQDLLKQMLSRDIRSLSQRRNPHQAKLSELADIVRNNAPVRQVDNDEEEGENLRNTSVPATNVGGNSGAREGEVVNEDGASDVQVLFHVLVEGIDIAYTHDKAGRVTLRNAVVVRVNNSIDTKRWWQYFTSKSDIHHEATEDSAAEDHTPHEATIDSATEQLYLPTE